MTLALDTVLWVLTAFCVLGWGGIGLCWLLFAIAWLKGWHRDDITPAEIFERLTAKKEKKDA